MNDINRILTALDAYTGEMDSLNETTAVFTEELGENWTQSIYQVLGDISLDRKERLDHAFNYYAATTAWNEIQSYIISTQPLNRVEVMERMPVLQHWLSFFGEAGQNAVTQLQEKLSAPVTDEERAMIQETARWGRPEDSQWAKELTESSSDFQDSDILSTESVQATQQEETPPEDPWAEAGMDVQEVVQETTEQSIMSSTSNVSPSVEQPIDTDFQSQPAEQQTPPEMPNRPVDTPVTPQQINQADIADPFVFDDQPLNEQPAEVSMPNIPQVNPNEISLVDPAESETDSFADTPFVEQDQVNAAYVDLENSFVENRDESIVSVSSGLPPLLNTHADSGFSNAQNPFMNTERLSESEWLIERTLRQINLLHNVQSWLAARCVHLGKIEIFSYKYYGFVVDFYRVLLKDIHTVLNDTSLIPLLESKHGNGVKYLQDTLLYLEQEIQSAEENSESDVTPLIADDLDMKLFKKTLGVIDDTNEKEYLGPAPDGFEMIEDPYESAQKQKQYEQLERNISADEKSIAEQIESPQIQKTTSQTSENSVQSKMSFSFTRKKPTE